MNFLVLPSRIGAKRFEKVTVMHENTELCESQQLVL